MAEDMGSLHGFDNEYFEAVLALEFDARNAEIDRRNDDTQYRRRNYIRAVFAYVEGNLFYLRQMALKAESALSPAERTALMGKYVTVGDNGTLSEENLKMSLGRHMKFAFNYFAKSVGIESQLDLGGTGWSLLTKAEKIRDRLMHPKGMSSLTITDEELNQVGSAAEWFHSVLQAELSRHDAASKTSGLVSQAVTTDPRIGLEQLFRQSGMGRDQFADFLIERGHPELVTLLRDI